FNGVRYGLKADSFEPYLDLPRRIRAVMELGIGGPGAPLGMFEEHGWRAFNPLQLTMDPWTYQQYIANSKAEFAIAKQAYAVTGSGWFSERTAAYMATGRPSVAQDTGFTRWLPSGLGIVPFASPQEALAGFADVEARYERHCRSARELIEQYFDSDL